MSWWGVWVDSHTVMRPSLSAMAALARGSSGHAASRGLITLPLVVTSHELNRSSLASSGRYTHVLVPTSGNTTTSSRADSVMSVTTGSGS